MILAAGESKRMGRPKLLLPFGEKTIVETIVETALQSKADKVIIVLGAKKEIIEKKIKDYLIQKSFNPNYHEGMLSSVQCGFRSLPENAKAALIMLGDQPSIPYRVIDAEIDVYENTGKGIILPRYKKRRGHPILIDMKYRREVESLDLENDLRALIYNHPEDTLEVPVDTPNILRDIDTIEDYRQELKDRENLSV